MNVRFIVTDNKFDQLSDEEKKIVRGWVDGSITMRGIRRILAHFIVDDQDNPVDYEKAMEMLGEMYVEDIFTTVREFVASIKMKDRLN
jgi:hypothetical protein